MMLRTGENHVLGPLAVVTRYISGSQSWLHYLCGDRILAANLPSYGRIGPSQHQNRRSGGRLEGKNWSQLISKVPGYLEG